MAYCRSGNCCVLVLKAVPILQICCFMVYSVAKMGSKFVSMCLGILCAFDLELLNTTK